jgi:isochorismate synthase EntC
MRIINKYTLIFFSLFIFTSCSFKSLIVSNFGTILTNRINKSLSLSHYDKQNLKKDITKFLETTKPQVTQMKKRLQQADFKGLNIETEFKFFGELYFEISKGISPILAHYIARFDKRKSEMFIERLNKENNKILSQIKERKDEDYIKRYEFIFGDLSKDQLSIVKSSISILKTLSHQRLDRRLKTQREFKILLSNGSIESKEKAVLDIFLKQSDRRILTKEQKQMSSKIQRIFDSLSEKQLKKLEERRSLIIEWIDSYIQTSYL